MNTVFDAMGIDAGVMIILLLVLEIVLLIAVFSSSMKIRRLNAKYTSFMKGQNGVSLEKDINKKMTRIDKYANSIGSLDVTIQAISDVQN